MLPAPAAAEVLFAADVGSAAVDSRGRSDTRGSLGSDLGWELYGVAHPSAIMPVEKDANLDRQTQYGCVSGETRPRYPLAYFAGVTHLRSFCFF